MSDSRSALREKRAAALAAVELVQDGMVVGLGSGTTVDHALKLLGERVERGLRVRVVVASERSEQASRAAFLSPEPLDRFSHVDLVIDGTDEVAPDLSLIKGGGAALVREKLLAIAGRELVIACAGAKRVRYLGAFPLPVAIVPFGAQHTMRRLSRWCPDIQLRTQDASPLVTDDGLNIADVRFGRIDDPAKLERELKAVTGVVEVGLFVGLAKRVFIGRSDGTAEEWRGG